MSPDQLKTRIEEKLATGTLAQVMDLTGTQDHYQVVIVSPAFGGKLPLERQRLVMRACQAEIDSGELHALTLKTFTPEEYQKL